MTTLHVLKTYKITDYDELLIQRTIYF
jgi:hypothetical protein